MNKKSNSKRTIKQVLALAFTLVLLIAGSYAWLTLQVTGNKTNILRAGTLKLTLDDTTSNGILLEKAVPMSDEKGKTEKSPRNAIRAFSFSWKGCALQC